MTHTDPAQPHSEHEGQAVPSQGEPPGPEPVLRRLRGPEYALQTAVERAEGRWAIKLSFTPTKVT